LRFYINNGHSENSFTTRMVSVATPPASGFTKSLFEPPTSTIALYRLRYVPSCLGTMNKRLWRCHVCNDIHFGLKAPKVCPTCGAKDAFVLVDDSEALKVIDGYGGKIETVEDMIETWESFVEVKEFKLNEDREMVRTLAMGELENMKNKGFKYCPCRITIGDFEKDLNLICPCNFLIQETWKEYGECWCGLFVKR